MSARHPETRVAPMQQDIPRPPRPPVLSNPNSTNPPAPRPPRIATENAEDNIPPFEIPGESTVGIAFYGYVTVIWESAEPIRLLRKQPLGPEFNSHYAIRIIGLPPETYTHDTGEIPLIFRLLGGATLQTRFHRRIPADYVATDNSLIFAFPKASLPLKPTDRSVTFALNLNEMSFKVRFEPRRMIWNSHLAL
jgi:hypothetical protein